MKRFARSVQLLTCLLLPMAAPAAEQTAIFAGGCFWCTEADFDKVAGVLGTTSGYIGGDLPDPDYQQVSAGGSGHIEAVKVRFDDSEVSYQQLLDAFWPTIDPLDDGGQFCDRGEQYQSAIFFLNAQQQRLAEASRDALQASARLPGDIATRIVPATEFWPAEDYHQNYAARNPLRYHYYRRGCGRDQRLNALWGKE